MKNGLLSLALLGLVAPAFAAGGMVNLSLVEALSATRQPQLAGIFSFISEKDAPFAFADLVARDPKALKRYLKKIAADRDLANGLTAWDHQVCASLVNLYSSPISASFDRPSDKNMSAINQCVLSNVVTLQDIVSRRKK